MLNNGRGLTLQELAHALHGEISGGQVRAPGPGHGPQDRSLCVRLDGNSPDLFVVYSHSGDDPLVCKDYVRSQLGWEPWRPKNGNGHKPPRSAPAPRSAPTDKSKVVATYDYRDAAGTLLYQKLKYEPGSVPQYRQRAANGTYKLDGIKRVLYRLPQLIADPAAFVFICEGEKDADRVATLDLCAVSGDSGTWKPDLTEPLRGREVVILPDIDDAGTKRALEVANALVGVANSIRVVRLPGLGGSPKYKDVSNWLDADPKRADILATLCVEAPLWAPAEDAGVSFAPYDFPDPASIPAREWLFGRYYVRGTVGATIGAPGRLKSTTTLTEVIGMAVGRDLMTGEALPSGPLRAAYLNGEEIQDELDRRVAATLQRFGVKPSDCGNRLWVRSTLNEPITVAVPGPQGGAVIQQDAVDKLLARCRENQIDVLVLDPLISFHKVRESDNGDMDLVCKQAFQRIAGNSRSVEVVHHPRKLAPGESNATVEDARGASAIIAAVRRARTFNFMTTSEASQLGIPEDDRRRYVRIESGKNTPGPVNKAHWVKIETELLPNGDEVACSTLWKLPNPFDRVTVNDLKVVQKWVQSGAFRTDSQSPDWLGWWMAKNLSHLNIKTRHSDKPRNKPEVARLNNILKTWVKNKVLAIEERLDDKRRTKGFYIVGEIVAEAHEDRIVPQ